MYRTNRDLEFALPDGRFDASGEFVCSVCPACGQRDKLYINVEKMVGFCFGGKIPCGVRILGLQDFIDLFEGRLENLAFVAARLHGGGSGGGLRRALPWDTLGGVAWDNPEARFFLEVDRGLSETIVRAVPIGYKEGRIVVCLDPVSDEFSPEVYVRPEDGSDKWMPARSGVKRTCYAFGWKQFLRGEGNKPDPTVVITEGIFDILQTGLLGSAISVMGSSLAEPLAICLAPKALNPNGLGARAIIWTDADAAGDKARKQFAKALTGWGVPFVQLKTQKDPKHYTPAEAGVLVHQVAERKFHK